MLVLKIKEYFNFARAELSKKELIPSRKEKTNVKKIMLLNWSFLSKLIKSNYCFNILIFSSYSLIKLSIYLYKSELLFY